MSEIAQFEAILKEIGNLKAPGVSGSRIKQLTDIAVRNVKDESKLIPVLYSSCKSIPSANKLGSMYVVDSVVRAYVDEARKNGETIDSSAPDGTFAAGVYKLSELIESLMDDALDLCILKSQTIKLTKLIEIWERAQTFNPEILRELRSKYITTTTPPGSPPPQTRSINSNSASATSTLNSSVASDKPSNSNSILLALASLAQKSNSNSSTPNPQNTVPANSNANANNILAQLSSLSGASNIASNAPPVVNNSPPPQSIPSNNVFNMLQQMQNSQPQVAPQVASQVAPQVVPQNNFRNDYSGRDHGRNDQYSRRDRSRSPNRNNNYSQSYQRRERSPPRSSLPASLPQIPRANGGGYNQSGPYKQNPPYQQNNYQQPQVKSPQFQNSQTNNVRSPPSGQEEMNVEGNPHYRPRTVGFDSSLPQGSIKVLSRTLFIGGVPKYMTEAELSNILSPYAEVQSTILNNERKHAFVKVYSRKEAEAVLHSFNKDNSLPLRTRWGVGFGPRDCCNYQHGVSIIPIERLTEADQLWVSKAQWGGSGGQPILSGMVIDEPDIEIGSGISSKAMSRKMPTNSARNGPKSNMPGEVELSNAYGNITMSHGGQPNFSVLLANANPLQNLFNNGNTPQVPAGLPNIPNSGNFMQSNGPAGNPNFGAQLSNFFNQKH